MNTNTHTNPEATMTNLQTWTITVVEPCDCYNCQRGEPWFMCDRIDERVIAQYEWIQDGCLYSEQIVWAQNRHPGKSMIY